jgi:hypothetical protein
MRQLIAYTKPVGVETMSLLTLLPFFGIALILAVSSSSYLGPATESLLEGGEALQPERNRDGEGVGIMDKRS